MNHAQKGARDPWMCETDGCDNSTFRVFQSNDYGVVGKCLECGNYDWLYLE